MFGELVFGVDSCGVVIVCCGNCLVIGVIY